MRSSKYFSWKQFVISKVALNSFRAGGAVSLLGNELYLFVVNADLFFVIFVPDPSPLIR